MSGSGLFNVNDPKSKGFTWEGMKKKKEVSERQGSFVKIVVLFSPLPSICHPHQSINGVSLDKEMSGQFL